MKVFSKALVFSIACALSACGSQTEAPYKAQESSYFLSLDQVIDIDGIKVRYRDEGPRDGQPLILVHGFTSSLETWDPLAYDLQSDYRVIRLDLPGHGLTGPDPEARYTNEETVDFLADFIETVGVEKPVLVGNSLGGLASWRLAVRSPELVSKLVLIAPGGFSINGVGDDPVAVPMMVKLYLTKAPQAGVKQATSALFSDPTKLSEDRLKEVRDMMLVPGNGDAFVARAASFTLPDPTQDLESIGAPSLLIWGQGDFMVPVAHAEKFAKAMPNAQLKIYADTGHVLQEESPKKLASDIRKFLTEQE